MVLLTDLPLDVFQFILLHLNYLDLMNLADTSQYLRNMAKADKKLKQKIGTKRHARANGFCEP